MADQDEDPRARPFLESDLDPDPLAQFGAWFRAAQEAGIELPEAMALATATQEGQPSGRMVLLKGFDERGFVFYSGYESRKGRDLAGNPRAALLFYWHVLGRQVRVEGEVERTTADESETYFRTRPPASRLAAWASRQSEVIGGRGELEAKFAELKERYPDGEAPLPPSWGGYRLVPSELEFWQHREDRLHDRFRYTREAEGWRVERLAP